MYTGSELKKEYSFQITPYHGNVHAEILCNNKSFKYEGLWILSMYKSFGSFWGRSAPREKDYINAQKWVDEQVSLLEKYGTVVITKPEYLNNK